jgi:hypothetical protein
MKTTIIIGLCILCGSLAFAQTNQIATNAPVKAVAAKPKLFVMPDVITTRTGHTYSSVELDGISPSEINISYTDGTGVRQLDNVKLSDLPDNLQKAFHYDPKKAAAYDEKERQREAQFSSQNPSSMTPSELQVYQYNSTIDRRIDELDAQIRQDEIEEQVRQEMLQERAVEAQEKAADAAMIQAQNPPTVNVEVNQKTTVY